MSEYHAIEINKHVKWVGVHDYHLVTFDVVMETKYGSTYNSYFIEAEQPCIIDTVKKNFWPDYLARLEQLTDITQIRYLVLNHTEPDHSGCVSELLELNPDLTIVGSGNAIRYLQDMVSRPFNHRIVKDGHELDLGDRKLRFIAAPNLHWPDTMYTWLEDGGVLFSCDSFGSHYAHEAMWDDQVGDFEEAFRYYFDVILKPFSKFMLKAIEKIQDLPIQTLAPGHGPILRTHWKKYVDLSRQLAEEALRQPETNYVFIPYVSAYELTASIARAIGAGIQETEASFRVEPMDIEHASVGEMEMYISKSSAIIVGCPTINQNILLPVYKLFSVINPLRDKGKMAGGFGSYGWSGENKDLIKMNLSALKLRYFKDGLFVKFTPDDDELEEAKNYGREFAKAMLNDRKN